MIGYNTMSVNEANWPRTNQHNTHLTSHSICYPVQRISEHPSSRHPGTQ